MTGTLLVLDSLFDDLQIETATAAELGWDVARWDGGAAALAGAEAVMHVSTRIDAPLQARMPACRVITRFGTGLDTVDRVTAAERGISVVNVHRYCTPELATHTLGLAFALDRRINDYEPDWSWQQAARHVALPGRRRAAVVGFGAIGQAVAHALQAMGIEVRVVTQHNTDRAAGFAVEPLSEALAGADFVFLHAALSPETAGMIGAAQLDLLSRNAILINTARLGLVDQPALAAALSGNRIAGVGIDARLAPTSPFRPLLDDRRLLVTPHIGWYSERSAAELRRRAVENTIAEAMRLRTNSGSTA